MIAKSKNTFSGELIDNKKYKFIKNKKYNYWIEDSIYYVEDENKIDTPFTELDFYENFYCLHKKNMEYNLTFTDVLNEIFKNKKLKCWYQGEDFMEGYFIKLNEFDEINLYYFSKNKFGKQNTGYLPLTNGVLKQKFRRVYTQPDVMRSI